MVEDEAEMSSTSSSSSCAAVILAAGILFVLVRAKTLEGGWFGGGR